MVANREWVKRNLGFDPVARPAPKGTWVLKAAATSENLDYLQREIIDFDSEGREGNAFFAFTTATGLSRFTDIPWPKGMAPQTAATSGGRAGGPLPRADVLVVTWTVDEGHALSLVLTPGKDSHNDYRPYTHNFAAISANMVAGSPARQAGRLGAYWQTTIAGKSVVVFKSESHLSQDGPKIPNIEVWKQIIAEVQPKLVLTTGTGGGIGSELEVGDVIVSPLVRFDCIKKFKNQPFHSAHYSSLPAKRKYFAKATSLFKANADQLPKDNTRPPKILVTSPEDLPACIVTTDFFGFDTSQNFYKLQGLGNLSEMGDAVLGLVCTQMGAAAPPWVSVRNVSDPQISAAGMTLAQQANLAAQIYKGFGRWSTICSAITCWALIA